MTRLFAFKASPHNDLPTALFPNASTRAKPGNQCHEQVGGQYVKRVGIGRNQIVSQQSIKPYICNLSIFFNNLHNR